MHLEPMIPPKRRYKGVDPHERIAERREKILAVALDLFGTRGFRATTLAMLSVGAGVPHRYLIEIFPDKEEILWALYQGIFDEVRAVVLTIQPPSPFDFYPWIQTHIARACHTFAVDTRKLRITFIEVVGVSPAFEGRRRSAIRRFANLIWDSLGSASLALDLSPMDAHYSTIGLVGVFNEIMVEWALTDEVLRPSIDVPIGQITQIYVAAVMFMLQRGKLSVSA